MATDVVIVGGARTPVNRLRGSAIQAVVSAAQMIRLGEASQLE